jgi:hypothetical protein
MPSRITQHLAYRRPTLPFGLRMLAYPHCPPEKRQVGRKMYRDLSHDYVRATSKFFHGDVRVMFAASSSEEDLALPSPSLVFLMSLCLSTLLATYEAPGLGRIFLLVPSLDTSDIPSLMASLQKPDS